MEEEMSMTQTEQELKIVTLGQFKVSRGHRLISEETGNHHKVWKLFKYLLTKKGKTPHVEEIMETLWPKQQVTDINHAFRNLIYRLRKILEEEDTGDYIKLTGKTYNFNFNSDDYWWDAEQLEIFSDRARKTEDKGETVTLFKETLSLYQGFYLPKMVYDDWASFLRNYFHRIYLNNVLEITEILKEDNRYEEIRNICEQAFNYEQFEEGIHKHYVEALIELGQKNKARAHYNYLTSIFNDELGIDPANDIKSLLTGIQPQAAYFSGLSLDDLTRELDKKREMEGAFLCKPSTFRRLCSLEQVRSERNGQILVICSLSFTLKDYKISSGPRLEQKMDVLESVLLNCLRKGDIVSRWRQNEFLVLLTGLKSDNVDKIVQRIESNFKERSSLDGFEMHKKYSSL